MAKIFEHQPPRCACDGVRPGLRPEQARTQLGLMVTTLLDAAEQPGYIAAASTNGGPPPGLTSRDDSLIALVMARFGMWREEAIEDLILSGGI